MENSATANSTVLSQRAQNLDTAPVATAPMVSGVELQRYAPLAVWAVVTLTLIFIALRIIGSGFIPAGDARRHVAKVFTEKPYSDIIVMRPEYSMDHSPGWEWLLRIVHQGTGWNSDAMMSFSIASTLLFLLLAPFPWLRRPEAWIAALLAQMIAIPDLMLRLTQARPYLLSEGILIAILLSWSEEASERPSRSKLVVTTLSFALSVWIHGAWYLWALPIAAFGLAGRWRSGLWLTACWLAGTLGGAVLTGKPVEFLREALLIVSLISKEQVPQWVLVGEFRPSFGEFSTLILIVLVALWRAHYGKTSANGFRGPVFCMIALCWFLGLKADRFWADWGVPAVLVWLTLQFQEMVAEKWAPAAWKRVAAAALLGAPLLVHSTNDLDRRYSSSMNEVFLDGQQPELKNWVPESGGIFYSDNMAFFYNTFYKNPQGDWRYIVGMEPALMPEEDLKTFRLIQLNPGSFKPYEAWVEKMRPADRLEVSCNVQPNLPRLEWTNAAAGIWLGRLPGASLNPVR